MNSEANARQAPGRITQFFLDARPDDLGLLLSASASAYGVGLLAMLVLPFMIGATMNGLGLDEAQAGFLGTVEFLGVTVASLLAAPFIGRLPRRNLALAGAALAIIGNALSAMQSSYEVLLVIRAAVGFGCGLALAAGNATVANAENPEKLAAQMSILFVVLMVVTMTSFARVSDLWSYKGVYGALAVCMLVMAIFIFRLPQGTGQVHSTVEHPHAHRGILSISGIFMLFAMFAFALRDTMMWAFAERIGNGVGYGPDDLGMLFSVQAVIGIVGPLVASLVGSRYGLRLPVLLGIVLTGIVTYTILQSSKAIVPYSVGVLFISGTYFYALSYLTALAAELDTQGRIVAASGGFLVAGVAFGPAVSGALIVRGGYELSSWVNVGIVVVTLLLILVPLRAVGRKADTLPH